MIIYLRESFWIFSIHERIRSNRGVEQRHGVVSSFSRRKKSTNEWDVCIYLFSSMHGFWITIISEECNGFFALLLLHNQSNYFEKKHHHQQQVYIFSRKICSMVCSKRTRNTEEFACNLDQRIHWSFKVIFYSHQNLSWYLSDQWIFSLRWTYPSTIE